LPASLIECVQKTKLCDLKLNLRQWLSNAAVFPSSNFLQQSDISATDSNILQHVKNKEDTCACRTN